MTTTPSPIKYKPRRRLPILLVLGMLAIVFGIVAAGIGLGMLLTKKAPVALNQPQVQPPQKQTQSALVNSFGWTNQEAGAAHIPVDRAMQIIASQGMPQLKELPATPVPSPVPGSNSSGAGLFTQLGCNACHGDANSALAPTLHGIYGKPVTLTDGSTVTADDAYIKESILNSQAKVVQGFQPIMPSFQGKVSDDQINQLIDYIKTIGAP